jgi:hypothetical protein
LSTELIDHAPSQLTGIIKASQPGKNQNVLQRATVTSNLSESNVIIKFTHKIEYFGFKAGQRVAQRGISYKLRILRACQGQF